MHAPIPSLRGSSTHGLAAALYQRHHDSGAGRCVMCGVVAPCVARRHAAFVITAAGEDPRWYDSGPPYTSGAGQGGHA